MKPDGFATVNYEANAEFHDCYSAVIKHLQIKSDGALVWQKAWPTPPFLEHLSFHLGNQKFFIRLFDVNGNLEEPPNEDGTVIAAKKFNGIPCYIAMEKNNNVWSVVGDDWGLYLHKDKAPLYPNDQPINPPDLVTDEMIPLNDAELHALAVQSYIEILVEKLPNTIFYAPQFDRGVQPHIRIKRPSVNYDEALSIFACRSNEDFSNNDARKNNISAAEERLIELGIKHYIVDIKLISIREIDNDCAEYFPLHRLEQFGSIHTTLEQLGLV